MEDRFNQALMQLEKDLQSINTAREQVESTVKASTELQKVVGEYVTSVKKLVICNFVPPKFRKLKAPEIGKVK